MGTTNKVYARKSMAKLTDALLSEVWADAVFILKQVIVIMRENYLEPVSFYIHIQKKLLVTLTDLDYRRF